MHQIRFRLVLPQTPLGELTALPQTPYLDLRGPTSKGGKGEGRDRKGSERTGRGRGIGGGRLRHGCWGIDAPAMQSGKEINVCKLVFTTVMLTRTYGLKAKAKVKAKDAIISRSIFHRSSYIVFYC